MSYFQVNDASTIHEVIDGEAIMINLVSGNYYTLNASAALLWTLIQEKSSQESMSCWLAKSFSLAADVAEADLAAFLDHLKREDLIIEATETKATTSLLRDGAMAVTSMANYAAPQLTVFKDMQDLLLLDPIHEIGEQGWPHTAPKSKITA